MFKPTAAQIETAIIEVLEDRIFRKGAQVISVDVVRANLYRKFKQTIDCAAIHAEMKTSHLLNELPHNAFAPATH
jgi:hypothetical protein